MKEITIAGVKFSDPRTFVQGIAHCFDVETHFVPLNKVDTAISTSFEFQNEHFHLRGLIPSIFYKEQVYEKELAEAQQVIYLFPFSAISFNQAMDDLRLFNKCVGKNTKVDYLLNDFWQRKYKADTVTLGEIKGITGKPFRKSEVGTSKIIELAQIKTALLSPSN